MNIKTLVSSAAVAAAMFFPAICSAADASKEYAGKILLDVANHGEAWYVNPQSLMRVYLGRPHEALDRLKARAVAVNFSNIERLPLEGQGAGDAAYASGRAGFVVAPNDVIGAAWYVHPTLKFRMRLATPEDAWLVMRTGIPVVPATLKGITVEPEQSPQVVGEFAVKSIDTADTMTLEGGTKVRLLSVDIPANSDLQEDAMNRLKEAIAGGKVRLEMDSKDTDAEGRRLRFAFAGDVNLNYDLVRNGLAFHAIEWPNYKYAELLIVGSVDAMNQKRGFWNR
jgi:hypothetical protein